MKKLLLLLLIVSCEENSTELGESEGVVSDDAIGLARAINEIYTGKRGNAQIEVTMKSDSNSLKDSLNSSKQIEEKILRPTILALKQMISRRQIGRFDWVESKQCLADLLTKKARGVQTTNNLLDILRTGINN